MGYALERSANNIQQVKPENHSEIVPALSKHVAECITSKKMDVIEWLPNYTDIIHKDWLISFQYYKNMYTELHLLR